MNEEKIIALSTVGQLISAEIAHSGINNITEDTVNKAKDILQIISNAIEK